MQRSHRLARAGEPVFFRILVKQLHQTEVRYFHPPLLVDQNVLGLDVTVNDTVVGGRIGELHRPVAQSRAQLLAECLPFPSSGADWPRPRIPS